MHTCIYFVCIRILRLCLCCSTKPIEIEVEPEEGVLLASADPVSATQRFKQDVAQDESRSLDCLPTLEHQDARKLSMSLGALPRASRVRHLQTHDAHVIAATSHGDLLFPDAFTSAALANELGSRDVVAYKRSQTGKQAPVSTTSSSSDSSDVDGKHVPAAGGWCAFYKKSNVHKVLTNADARMAIAIYTFMSFAVIGYDEVFTVFASTDRALGELGLHALCTKLEPSKVGVSNWIVPVSAKMCRRYFCLLVVVLWFSFYLLIVNDCGEHLVYKDRVEWWCRLTTCLFFVWCDKHVNLK